MNIEDTHLIGAPSKASGKKCCRPKNNYPFSVFYILGNEFCERFSFYGMRAILVIFLTQWLRFGDDLATSVFHTFSMLCYVFPIFGAILSDGYIGKYKTILYLSIVHAIGNSLMAFTALPPPEWFGPILSLFLVALGTGGIKPCVAAFGGDQFGTDQVKELGTFFSIFYFSINLGSLFSMLITPVLRSEVTCFGTECYSVAFGVPAVLMIISLVLFVVGRSQYKMYPPTGNVIGSMSSCIWRALVNRCCHKTERKDHWLDYASDRFEPPFIEDVKSAMRVLFLFLPLPFFWTLFDQQGSRWTLQAVQMDGSLGVFGHIKPDQIQALNAILIVLLIPVFESFIYPLLNMCRIPHRPLQRMCFGMLLAASSFVVAGFVDLRIQAGLQSQLSVDESSIRIVNASPCPVYMSSPFLNESLRIAHANEPTKVQSGVYDLKFHATNTSYSPCDQKAAAMTTDLALRTVPHTAYQVVLMSRTQRLIAKQFSYDLIASWKGGSFVSIIYAPDSMTTIDGVMLINPYKSYSFNLIEFDRTPFKKIKPGSYEVHISMNTSGTNIFRNKIRVDSGAVYTIVIQHNVSNGQALEMEHFKISYAIQIPVWHQVPQYVLITAGEILFSITGLSFAYTQAPASMKSVLQAAWLLTVGVGNLFVIIAAETKMIDNQAYEFFGFAGLMVIDAGVFALMGYFYVYVVQERDYDELGGNHSTSVPEVESHAPRQNQLQPIDDSHPLSSPQSPHQ